MLSIDQIDNVSRSLIGHMATNPASRETIAAIKIDDSLPVESIDLGTLTALADAINAITQFVPAVTAEDVPFILTALRAIGGSSPGFTYHPGISHVIFGKG
jgi:hypothetical protein